MEQKYWEQFMKSGEVSDYLGYKMEVYGHGGGERSDADNDRCDEAEGISVSRRREEAGQGRLS